MSGEYKKAYILRSCNDDMTSHGGFQWPTAGPVQAPNWTPGLAKCGNGLHGLLLGRGNLNYCQRTEKWVVAAVNESECVWVDGNKVVFPRAWVVFVGPWYDALFYLLNAREKAGWTPEKYASGNYSQSASSGNSSQSASRGNYSVAFAMGNCCKVRGSEHAMLMLTWFDTYSILTRIVVAYVGEDGIKPDTWYRLNSEHQFEEVGS